VYITDEETEEKEVMSQGNEKEVMNQFHGNIGQRSKIQPGAAGLSV
jgi:hypothetical protein